MFFLICNRIDCYTTINTFEHVIFDLLDTPYSSTFPHKFIFYRVFARKIFKLRILSFISVDFILQLILLNESRVVRMAAINMQQQQQLKRIRRMMCMHHLIHD